ncbi:hypothetical protein ACFVH6_43750 [Spirillospora sp. NPDC127200]
MPSFVIAGSLTTMGALGDRTAGAAAAVGETTQKLGGALGIALIGGLGNAVYHGRMPAAAPDGLPAADTLPAALDAARLLPRPLGDALVSDARNAFAGGLQLTAAIAVPVLPVLAGPAVALLRHVRPAVGTPAGADGTRSAPLTSDPRKC